MSVAFLRSGGGGPADPDRLGGAAGGTARLPADGAAQRGREPRDISVGAVAVRDRPSAARALRAGRRPEHRLHRAQHLRRFHHQHLQRELHRARTRDRPADAGLSAFLPRHVPDHDVRHEPRLRVEQYRPDVGGGGNRHPDHGADGRHLSHPRRAGSGVEIFHPRQRRHRASRCSAPSWSTWRRVRWSAKARTAWSGRC